MENIISIGGLEYCLRYTIKNGKSYVAKREEMLGRKPILLRHYTFPRDSDRLIGNSVIHRSFAHGGFGWLSTGIHSVSGEPVAIKEVKLKGGGNHEEVTREAQFSLLFKKVVPMVHTCHAYVYRKSTVYSKRLKHCVSMGVNYLVVWIRNILYYDTSCMLRFLRGKVGKGLRR